AASPPGASFLDVDSRSFLQTDADGSVHALLKQTLEVVANRLRIAAAKKEAVALNGRQKRIDRTELGAGRPPADLAQVRPDMEEIAVAAGVDDGGETLLTGRRHQRGPRLRRRRGRGGVQGRPQVKAHLPVRCPVEPLALGLRIEAEATERIDRL